MATDGAGDPGLDGTFGEIVAPYEARLQGIRPNSPEWNGRMEVVYALRAAYRAGYTAGSKGPGGPGAEQETSDDQAD